MPELTLVEAVRAALSRAMEDDPHVLVMGEDVGIDGGVFRATDGLVQRFGSARVRDTPLSELLIAGMAVGVAAQGFRPVAEIQFMGFLYPTIDQLVNHASRLRTRTRGRLTCPMVLRAPYGGGIRAPEHHSESAESMLAHIPGLRLVIPSSPRRAYGLLLSAIRDPDPVVFLEPKRLYRAAREEVADDGEGAPLDRCYVLREGGDITLIGWGAMLTETLAAADGLSDQGVAAEVIDVATLKPLDTTTILSSIEKTGRCVIVHEASLTGGYGGEISARIAEQGMLNLVAPVRRVAGYDTVMPLPRLEHHYMPSAAARHRGGARFDGLSVRSDTMPDEMQATRAAPADQDLFRFADDLGPAKIIHVTQPSLDLRAILVVDNVACGPSIGGARMAPDVSVDECFRLARAMTLKNAAAGLPHGGGKSVIVGDPTMQADEKEAIMRAFARAIGSITDYIVGPDMGTDERCMAWAKDEIGRAVGLPREIGGIPLDEIGATGFGVAVAGEVAQEFAGISLDGARIAVQGFGAVGQHAARFLSERGAVLVGASDSRGTISDSDGLDIDALQTIKQSGGSVVDHGTGVDADRDAIIDVACDVWIPAARPDVIRADNVDRLDTKLILQGANIPVTADAEAALHARGVLSVPDFIANAGGVICAAVEYAGGTETAALATIEEKIRRNSQEVLTAARDKSMLPREAALVTARARVDRAMSFRRDV